MKRTADGKELGAYSLMDLDCCLDNLARQFLHGWLEETQMPTKQASEYCVEVRLRRHGNRKGCKMSLASFTNLVWGFMAVFLMPKSVRSKIEPYCIC